MARVLTVLLLVSLVVFASTQTSRNRRGTNNRRAAKRNRAKCAVPGCKPGRCSRTNKTECEACLPGWYLSEDAQCGQCGDGCQSCDGPGACSKCKKGHTVSPVTSLCLACSSHCDACDVAGGGGCDECRDRHMLHVRLVPEADRVAEVHECLPCGKGCSSCSIEEGCLACDAFYSALPKGSGCTFSFVKVFVVAAAACLAIFGCVYCLADEEVARPGAARGRAQQRKQDKAEVVRRDDDSTTTSLRSRHLVGYT